MQPPSALLATPSATGEAASRRPIRFFVFMVFVCFFWLFAFQKKHTPDFFVQLDYFDTMAGQEVPFDASLFGNTIILDYFIPKVAAATKTTPETALCVSYFAVFILKYALLLWLCQHIRYVIIIFLWNFSSLDINQFRLNFALVFFILLLAIAQRTGTLFRSIKFITTIAMLLAHLASAMALPVAATSLPPLHLRKRHFVLLSALAVATICILGNVDFLLPSLRFAEYLDAADSWFPKALLASPVMVFSLYGKFPLPTTATLTVLALAPCLVAAFQLPIVAARMIELFYTVFLVKIGLAHGDAFRRKTFLLMLPAALMFLLRLTNGANPSGE